MGLVEKGLGRERTHYLTFWIMRRKVARVCGAATEIPRNGERDTTSFEHGWVRRTVGNVVVLAGGGNALQVADARAFCAGSIAVRCCVELPRNASLAEGNAGATYGVACKKKQQEDEGGERDVYIVDFQTGEAPVKSLPALNEEVVDAFVDARGEQIVAVGGATGKLWGWNPCDCEFNEAVDAWEVCRWREVQGIAVDSRSVGVCSCGRFVCSSVMGNCFVYLRATRLLNGSVVLEKWIFDVDAGWSPVGFSSTETGNSVPAGTTQGLKLFTTNMWTFAVIIVGSTVYHIRIDQDLRNSLVQQILLDHQIVDGAWVDNDTGFALLLANGQMSVGAVNDTGCIELLAIATPSTMSKRLSLSALLGKAVSAALQLVWVAQEEQVVVDFGTGCVAFKLEIDDEERSANLTSNSTELFPCDTFAAIRRRRVMASLDKDATDLSECIRGLLELKPTPPAQDLLDTARIALRRSWKTFEDLYFMLISIIHQQLADASVNTGKSRDPIDCVGKSLKLMEVLISLTISMDGTTLRQVSAKIISTLHGCASGLDTKSCYGKEINVISQQVGILFSGVLESEDWWLYSMEAATFLRVYFTTMLQLVQEVYKDASPVQQKSKGGAEFFSVCQVIIEHDECSAASESILNIERSSGSLLTRLKQVLGSYTLMCRCLQVNGVAIDLEHLFSIDLPPTVLKRKELVCCFMKPWQRVDDKADIVAGQRTNRLTDMVMEAAKYATKANALQLIVIFCLESRSFLVHPCLQVLCKAAASVAEIELPWVACEMYIGEILAIFQHLGFSRQFRHPQRAVDCNVDGTNLSCAIDREFGVYHHTLSTKLTKAQETCRVDLKETTLWDFSHADTLLCARVICLISRIIWHLEAINGGFGNLIRHSFGMTLFDPRLQKLPAEDETVYDCITTVREAIIPTEAELRLPRFGQPQDFQAALTFKSQKIARTVVLIAWILWLREKSAYCTRGYHTFSDGHGLAEKETLGALAATCALHLNSVGMVCGYHEELLSIQLTLLEEAATINPCKSAAIIAWGFPQHRILTRHLKRYKNLRRAMQQTTLNVSLDERELHYQHLHKRIRRAFLQVQGMNEKADNGEIDMLVSACCDPEFLQIMAVLTRSPYEVVAVSHGIPNPPDEISVPLQEGSDASPEHIEPVLITRITRIKAETLPDPIPHVEQVQKPQIAESLISRDEVIALLQGQTRHLEEKIHAVAHKEDRTSRSSTSHDNVQETKTEATLQVPDRHKVRTASKPLAEIARDTAIDLADAQQKARIPLQVRNNLNRQRYPSAHREADMQSNQQPKPAQQHESIRNVLKLFRLRQENGGHLRTDQENSNRLGENGIPNIRESTGTASETKNDRDTQDPTVLSLQRDKLRYAGVKRKSTRSQRSDQGQCYASKEPVYPLRLEYGTDSASLKLLGRNFQQRNPSVKKRQFVHESERTRSYAYQVKARAAALSVEPTEAVQLKNCGAQTNDVVKSVEPPASVEKERKEWTSQQNEIGPEKGSPVAPEFIEDKSSPKVINSNSSRRRVGTQCRVVKDGQTQANRVRRLRGPPPLTIADKFPIWVDLDGVGSGGEKNHFKERKHFLRVARFGSLDMMDNSVNNGSAEDSQFLPISSSASIVLAPRKLSSEDGSEENQSDGRRSPTLSSVQGEDDRIMNEAMNAKYRASYRQHYPFRERLSRISDDHDSANGIDTLIDLRDNMQRMTQRLRKLETCANSIDKEFKDSQKRLSQIGDGNSSQTRILDNIDEVLEMTDEFDGPPGEQRSRGGLLSKKASSDLNAAKKLLETIEQLTISASDE